MASSSTTSWRCGVCQESFSTAEDAKQHAREKHTAIAGAQLVSVAATTWNRDIKGLFDREDTARHQHQGLVLPVGPGAAPLRFLREGQEVRLAQGQAPPEASPIHTQLRWGSQGLLVEKIPTSSSNPRKDKSSKKDMWLNVGDGGYALQRGSLVKCGNYMASVKQIVLSGPPQVPNFSSVKDPGMAPVRESQDEAATCRICLDTGDTEDEGPMIIAPCLCKGGVSHIHLGCLRHWLSTRYSVVNRMKPLVEGAAAFSFKPPACEICKTEFPAVFTTSSGEKPVDLLTDLPLIQPPFIVLSLPRSADKERPHGERCVFAPGGKDATLTIGRSHEAGLQLLDVSVSRLHATVKFVDNQFILESKGARFGTVVRASQPSALVEDESLSIQAGRTVLQFLMEPMVPVPEEALAAASGSSGAVGVSGAIDAGENSTPDSSVPLEGGYPAPSGPVGFMMPMEAAACESDPMQVDA